VHRLVPIFAILALSCGNTTRPDFVVHLVDAGNGNPFAQCQGGSVRVDVQQGSSAVLTSNGTLTTGGVLSSLSVEIPSFGLPTQIEVTAVCNDPVRGSITLIGATPHFLPIGFPFVDIVLGEPETCALLSTPRLSTARIAPHFVRLNANLVALGGIEPSGAPSVHVQAIDAVTLTSATAAMGDIATLSQGVGAGSAFALDDTHVAFASDLNRGVFDAAPDASPRELTGLNIPQSATSEAALIGIPGNFVAFIGGAIGSDAVSDITWVSTDGSASSSGSLMFARRRPGVALIQNANRILVVGGQAAGEPLFELVTLRGDSIAAFGPSTNELRYGAVVATDTTHARALVVLGSDAHDGGTLYTTSWAVSSCSASGCDFAPGPTFADPRTSVAVVEHHLGVVGAPAPMDDFETLVVGGTDAAGTISPLIDRLHWDGAAWSITAAASLRSPRSSPGAADVGGGIVLTGGGADERGNGDPSLEICFPRALRPIGAE
jgi:hypothetical protein